MRNKRCGKGEEMKYSKILMAESWCIRGWMW